MPEFKGYWKPQPGANTIRFLPPVAPSLAHADWTPIAWAPPIGRSRVLLFPLSRQERRITDGRYFPRKRFAFEGVVFDHAEQPGHHPIVWEIGERFAIELDEATAQTQRPYLDLIVDRSGTGRNAVVRISSMADSPWQSTQTYDEQGNPSTAQVRRIRV